ncbi:MAG: RHS repeat protein [Kiritimatiellae bacterium]|nr:RHS repeat protein [Kiritimatiellia bacterium]
MATVLTVCACATAYAAKVYFPPSAFTGCIGPRCHATNPYPNGLWVNVPADESNDDNPNPDAAATRDPINVLTGCVTDYADDLKLPDPVFPLTFSRFYVSGRGWRHSFDIRLERPSTRSPRIAMPDGQILPFSSQSESSGEWRTYRDVDWRLIAQNGGHVVEMGDAGTAYFADNGRLNRIVDSCGNVLQLTYSGTNLVSVSRNGTEAFSLSYSDGRLVCVETPDESYYVQYGYSSGGDLESVSVTVGGVVRTTGYSYGPYGLTAKINAMGVPTYYGYCSDASSAWFGRAVGLVHGDGFYEHEIQYFPASWNSSSGAGCKVTYWRDGEPTVHEYASIKNLPRVASVRIVDPGLSGGCSNEVMRTYGYDNNYRKISERLQESRFVAGNPMTASATHTRTYDLDSVSAFRVETFSYNGASVMKNYTWDASRQHITAVNNAFGGLTRFSYSTNGLLAAVWQSAGTVYAGETTYARDSRGLVIEETNPRGGTRQISRDGRGFPVSAVTPDGVAVSYEYDALGHLLAASRCGVELFRNTVDADGRVTRTDYPDGTFETVAYDAMRRPVEMTDRSGRTTTLAYSVGNTVTNQSLAYILPGGGVGMSSRSMRHDTQLNTREIRNEDFVAVESYALDANDRVVAVTNAEGQVARMSYELGNRVSSRTRFDGSEVNYAWNAYGLKEVAYSTFTNMFVRMMDGSLSKATGPNGAIEYKYDKFGNVTNVVTEQGGISGEYDFAGDVVRKSWSGGSVTYEYDLAGRVTNMVWNVAGLMLPFGCTYSPTNGAVSRVAFPNSISCETGYDVMDRLSRLTWSGYVSANSDSREYSYDNADNITSIQHDDGRMSDYTYDGLDRLTGESVYSASGTMVRLAAQVYDASGNRTAQAVTENGVTEFRSSMFMPGDRLAEWTSENASGAYAVVTNAAYFYADSGCTTGVVSHLSDGTSRTVKYSWTDDYRLDRVDENGETMAEYKYDALGNLVSVRHGAEAFEILVDEGHTLADVSEDGTPLRVYMRGPGVDRWLGLVDLTGGSPIPYFYVTDHLGSVLAVTDASGAVVERYEYDAWGKVLSVADAEGQTLARSAIGNRILWQGREYSWTTGLYYFRNRWYDPVIGRWISKDPIGIEGGLNIYGFCDSNPINFNDAEGCGKVSLLMKTVKGAWKYVSRSSAVKKLRNGKDVMVTMTGDGRSKKAKRLLEEAKGKGKRIVRHDGHKPGQAKHFQPKQGDGTHIRLPGAHLTSGTLIGEALDFFNPISDIQDIIDLICNNEEDDEEYDEK